MSKPPWRAGDVACMSCPVPSSMIALLVFSIALVSITALLAFMIHANLGPAF